MDQAGRRPEETSAAEAGGGGARVGHEGRAGATISSCFYLGVDESLQGTGLVIRK